MINKLLSQKKKKIEKENRKNERTNERLMGDTRRRRQNERTNNGKNGHVVSTMVKPLEKSIKFWDGHGLLRLVEL